MNYSIVLTKRMLWVCRTRKSCVTEVRLSLLLCASAACFRLAFGFWWAANISNESVFVCCQCISDLRHMKWRQRVSIYTLHSKYKHICHILLYMKQQGRAAETAKTIKCRLCYFISGCLDNDYHYKFWMVIWLPYVHNESGQKHNREN